MKKANQIIISLLIVILFSCKQESENIYSIAVDYYIPDSSMSEYRKMVVDLTTASHKHLSGGKIEDANIHWTITNTAFDLYKERTEGLNKLVCTTCSGTVFYPYNKLTPEEKIIFTNLKNNAKKNN